MNTDRNDVLILLARVLVGIESQSIHDMKAAEPVKAAEQFEAVSRQSFTTS